MNEQTSQTILNNNWISYFQCTRFHKTVISLCYCCWFLFFSLSLSLAFRLNSLRLSDFCLFFGYNIYLHKTEGSHAHNIHSKVVAVRARKTCLLVNSLHIIVVERNFLLFVCLFVCCSVFCKDLQLFGMIQNHK